MFPECRKPLTRSKLFFPDNDKDYAKDELVYRDWEVVTEKLKRAFHLTIFGYSGPKTDCKATLARRMDANSHAKIQPRRDH